MCKKQATRCDAQDWDDGSWLDHDACFAHAWLHWDWHARHRLGTSGGSTWSRDLGRGWALKILILGVQRFNEWPKPLHWIAFPVEFLTNTFIQLNAWTPFSKKVLLFIDCCFVASPSQNSAPKHRATYHQSTWSTTQEKWAELDLASRKRGDVENKETLRFHSAPQDSRFFCDFVCDFLAIFLQFLQQTCDFAILTCFDLFRQADLTYFHLFQPIRRADLTYFHLFRRISFHNKAPWTGDPKRRTDNININCQNFA